MTNKTFMAVGIGLIMISVFMFSGFAPKASVFAITTTEGIASAKLTTDVISTPIFATVAPGGVYKWRLTATNTGSIDWSDSRVTLRLGINGATSTLVSESGVNGQVRVEQCSLGTNIAGCRENLRDRWTLTATSGGSLQCDSDGKVCSLIMGAITKGNSKTAEFTVKTPTDISSGSFPLISNLVAVAGSNTIAATDAQPIDVGTINGTLVVSFIGTFSMIGGLFLLGRGFGA